MSRVFDAISALEIGLRRKHGLHFRVAHALVRGTVTRVIAPRHDAVVRHRVHGAELLLPLSHALPRYVADQPFYDSALPNFAKFLLSDSAGEQRLTVVDIGANVGDTARLVAAATGADRVRFICVEADETYLPLLRRNTEGLDTEIHNVIAGSVTHETHASMNRTGEGTTAVISGGEARQVVSLDDIVKTRQIDLLKIDTDGYEAEVLRGATRLLSDGSAPCFIEFSPWHIMTYGKVTPSEVIDLLRDAGYGTAIIYDNVGYPMGLTQLSREAVDNITNYCFAKPGFYVDILAAKDRDLLERFYHLDMKRYPMVEHGAH